MRFFVAWFFVAVMVKPSSAEEGRDPRLVAFDKATSTYVTAACTKPPTGFRGIKGARFQVEVVAKPDGTLKTTWISPAICY